MTDLLARIDNLSNGEYFVQDNMVYVKASTVDAMQFHFTCPFCYEKYKKNGEPYAKSKHLVHRHGSGGDKDTNRLEHNGRHCRPEINKLDFCIGITPSTVRL